MSAERMESRPSRKSRKAIIRKKKERSGRGEGGLPSLIGAAGL